MCTTVESTTIKKNINNKKHRENQTYSVKKEKRKNKEEKWSSSASIPENALNSSLFYGFL